MPPVRSLASARVAEAEFAVTYDGPALASGRMPVRDLAPALLALGELFAEASLEAYPDREPVALNIRATAEGSFLVQLAIHSPDLWDQVVTFFSAPAIVALTNLQTILIDGKAGLFWLIKTLRGRHIVSERPLEPGEVRLRLDDGSSLEVRADVLTLYRRPTVRRKARQVVEPLARPGVQRVDFTSDEPEPLSVLADDLPAYEVVEPDEAPLSDREEVTVVSIVVASFEAGYKWRLSEGDTVFTASIEDPAFRARIDSGESFRKGDMLRCRMRVVQTQRDGGLHVERTVLEVLDHIARAVQLELEPREEDGEAE